jgi:hypothetical protein
LKTGGRRNHLLPGSQRLGSQPLGARPPGFSLAADNRSD